MKSLILSYVSRQASIERSRKVTYIHENGWILFVVSEGLTWVLVALFLLSRYWLCFDRLSQLWLMLIVA